MNQFLKGVLLLAGAMVMTFPVWAAQESSLDTVAILKKTAKTMSDLTSFYGERVQHLSNVIHRKQELDRLPNGGIKERLTSRKSGPEQIRVIQLYRRYHPDGFVEGKTVALTFRVTDGARERFGPGVISIRNRSGNWQIIGEKAILQKEQPWQRQEAASLRHVVEALSTEQAPEIAILNPNDEKLFHLQVKLPKAASQRLADIRDARLVPTNPDDSDERKPVAITYHIGKKDLLLYGEEHQLKSGETLDHITFDRVEANPRFNDSTFQIPKGIDRADGRNPTLNYAHMIQEMEKSIGLEERPIEEVVEEVTRLTKGPVKETPLPNNHRTWVILALGLLVVIFCWQVKLRS